jgi:hypothetical protein
MVSKKGSEFLTEPHLDSLLDATSKNSFFQAYSYSIAILDPPADLFSL